MKEFDYNAAIKELEEIESKVQDPAVPLEQIDSLLSTSRQLVGECRKYLRSQRQKLED